MKKIFALLLGLLGLTTNASAQSDSIKTIDAAQFEIVLARYHIKFFG